MNQDDIERQVLSMKGETVIFPKAGDYAIKHPDGTIMMCAEQPQVQRQVQIVDILCRLTKAGRATWLRRKADREWLYCFVESEQIVLELAEYSDDDDNDQTLIDLESVKPDTCFTLHYRGETLLYLAGLYNGDKLIHLVKSIDIPINDEKWAQYYREWEKHLLDPLIAIDGNSLQHVPKRKGYCRPIQ